VRVTDKKFVFTDAGWKRSAGGSRTVPVTAQGKPPAYTDDFPTFACRGLPRVL
jgi:hypothetical protein